MSKVDAMRALREAKHARGGALPDSPARPGPRVAATPVARKAAVQAEAPATAPGADELCGHRNMGGKSCSRPAGHSEKNHRYR
jgi:hypothetical protein